MISCGSCFSPTTRKDGKQVGKRNMGAALQRHPSRRPTEATGPPSPPALSGEPPPQRYLRDAPRQPTQPGKPRSLPLPAAHLRSAQPHRRRRRRRALRALPAPALPRERKEAARRGARAGSGCGVWDAESCGLDPDAGAGTRAGGGWARAGPRL